MSTQQLACTYAALILADSGKCDANGLIAVAKAAGVEISKGMAAAYAKILESVSINEVLSGIAFGGGAPAGAGAGTSAAAGGAASAAAAAAPAAAKEEEEEDDDMGFGLFD